MSILLYILLGIFAGILSGLIGIGGGIVIVPALVFLFGLSQYKAQGTTIALMVPPIGILAAWTYYRQGFVDLKIATFVCLGFLVGGLVGARMAVGLPIVIVEKIFGAIMLFVALKMLLA